MADSERGVIADSVCKKASVKTYTDIDKCKGFDNHRSMETKADRIAGEVRKRKIVRPKDLSSFVGSRSHLSNLARSGRIERIGRGLYRDSTSSISDNETYAELAKRVPEGVLCLSSALRYHELTTENPSEIWLAIERGAWTPKIDFPPVRIAHFSEPAFDFGIEIHPLNGVQLRVYSPAKTVADCFKFRSKIGTETAIQALRATYREKRATMDELWKAAKVCRVSNIIRPYMESLT
jgi:predicted transcriptional regulator of viral defense system